MHGHAVLTFAVAWLDRGSLYNVHPVTLIAGGTIILAGATVISLGRKAYGDQRRVYGLIEDCIINHGIYRWSRNPQYLGYGLIFTGAVIATGSGIGFIFTVVFMALIHAGITHVEEPHLHRAFGRAYADYQLTTARYLSLRRRS